MIRMGATVMVGDRQKPSDGGEKIYASMRVCTWANALRTQEASTSCAVLTKIYCRACNALVLIMHYTDGLLYTPCDVTDVGNLTQLLEDTVRKIGPVTIWVNNAGLEIETNFKPFGKKAMAPENRAKILQLINVNMVYHEDGHHRRQIDSITTPLMHVVCEIRTLSLVFWGPPYPGPQVVDHPSSLSVCATAHACACVCVQVAMIDGTRIAVQHMQGAEGGGQGGSVLNVSSLSAFIPMAAAPVYSATKVPKP